MNPDSCGAFPINGNAGAPLIEIGIPFSDPTADGPTLQAASRQALAAGFSLEKLLEHLPAWSNACPAGLVVMSYLNVLMRPGLAATFARLQAAGIQGLIVPDLPADAGAIHALALDNGLDLVRLVAPTTSDRRLAQILAQCSGFVYAVALAGVTGARQDLPQTIPAAVGRIRRQTDLPVCVGFGISQPAQVDRVLRHAHGAIVGSYLMQQIMQAKDPAAAAKQTYLDLIRDIGP